MRGIHIPTTTLAKRTNPMKNDELIPFIFQRYPIFRVLKLNTLLLIHISRQT